MSSTTSPAPSSRPRLILVSNRLPVALEETPDGPRVERTTGGLATGLAGPHRDSGGFWIGWPGVVCAEPAPGEEPRLAPDLQEALRERQFVGVALTEAEHERYYMRASNRCIWPLFHYFTDRVHYSDEDWAEYVRINRRFADAVLEVARPGDVVFVQDFHLMLVPRLLRDARPDLRIGFFLHIPFPSSEIFRIFPPRAQVMEGLLGADMIGFHTLDYVRHFRTAVQRVSGLETHGDEIHYQGRRIRLCARPLGIEASAWTERVAREEVRERVRELREMADGRRIVLGVERLDYTKGLPERLQALKDYLTRDPSAVERVMMIQIAVPSRVEVEEYRELKDEVDRLVGAINGQFGRPGLQPLQYVFRGVPPDELAALYAAADVALVTPLRDGLNLVAKEYVAARGEDSGVLVLGEFTGAAWELGEALHVNPFDRASMVDALAQALEMPPGEQAERMAPMRARVARNDVGRWAEECLELIQARPLASDEAPPLLEEPALGELLGECRRRPLQLFLDYDGTLREFTDDPAAATPSAEALHLVGSLAALPDCLVWIVSGRPPEVLEEWLGDTGAGLVAEHGAWIRRHGEGEFRSQFGRMPTRWRPIALEAMRQFTDRVPGSFVETKPAGLAWHYRAARPGLATWQARELYQHLVEVFGGEGVEVMRGDKVVEVRPSGVSKGSALAALVAEDRRENVLCLAAGDDRTDETMFRSLPPGGWSILVGERLSEASYRLPHPAAFRGFLAELLGTLT